MNTANLTNPQFVDAQDKKRQIISDIEMLQKIEKDLFSNLENNQNTITKEEVQVTIEKINSVSDMRITLYKTLNEMNSFFQSTLSNSANTLTDQSVALNIVEQELLEAKRRLELLQDEKYSKFRTAEINDYYSDKYAEQTEFLLMLIFVIVLLIIVAVVYKTGIMHYKILFWVLTVIFIFGGGRLLIKFLYMRIRDNMNYQEYNWKFKIPDSNESAVLESDPWIRSVSTCSKTYDYNSNNGLTYTDNTDNGDTELIQT
jgi:hypothetical protein